MTLQTLAPHIWNIWQQGNYCHTIPLLLEAQSQYPEQHLYRYYLGLAYILKNDIEKAHIIWQLKTEQAKQIPNLNAFLVAEATKLEQEEQWSLVVRLRQQIRIVNPKNLNNQLHLILLLMRSQTLVPKDVSYLDECLQTTLDNLDFDYRKDNAQEIAADSTLLLNVIQYLFQYDPALNILSSLVKKIIPLVGSSQEWKAIIKPRIIELAENQKPGLAYQYTQIYLELSDDLDTDCLDLIRNILWFIVNCGHADKAIDFASILERESNLFLDKLFSNTVTLYASQKLGEKWSHVKKLLQRQEELLDELIIAPNTYNPFDLLNQRFHVSLFLKPYLYDQPQEHHRNRRRLGDFIQANFRAYLSINNIDYQVNTPVTRPNESLGQTRQSAKLRIGYIGEFLRQHSVGWIARWLFQYHNHDKFEIYTYLPQHRQAQRFSQDNFLKRSDVYRVMGHDANAIEIAQVIQRDRIDILIDMDSYTSSPTCGVMALKPAPVQATWLGWDASGLSTIDYFIADPYVLPQDAQEYYTETVWRLPQTYLAVQGFEVSFPTRKRTDLDIPDDAIVYLSNQNALKRQDDFIRVQMQVLKAVKNSYFLIKVVGDLDSLKEYFETLAEEENINPDRLRFLPFAPTESLYRGNLNLADVVLDSYPYNGATTTLETLWVGLPLVTRVGDQFSSRNSYSMMINAGVEEGIAWTDEEYIQWAVRFGLDESLRQKVFLKLMRSRHFAPLWNAKQFTSEMENAYEKMWTNYVEN